MLKITKKQKQAMKENEWAYKIYLKAEGKLGQGTTSVGLKVIDDYMETSLKKNKDTFQAFMEYQFRTNNKLLYDEYQVIVDMVLLGK